MSQYLNFYIRSKNDEFIQIASYSRSSYVYDACLGYFPYQALRPFSKDKYEDVEKKINERINLIKTYIKNSKKKIKILMKSSCDVDKTIARIDEELELIKQYKEDRECLFRELSEIRFISEISQIMNNSEEEKNYIYAGIEVYNPSIKDIV